MATALQPNVGATLPAAGTPAAGTPATAAPNPAMIELAAQSTLNDALTTPYAVSVPGGKGQMTLSAGINTLARMYGARQNRLADISVALANYTNTTGNMNQAAVIKVQQENSSNDILNSLIKSLFDKQQDSIKTWTRLQ